MRRFVFFALCFGLIVSCAKDGESARYPDRPGGECSRTPGASCKQGFVCHYGPSAECGETGASGACFPMPTTCTKDYSPVCGCDGRTYVNICVAHSHGVSPRRGGECTTGVAGAPPGSCGEGGEVATCTQGFFCNYDEAQFCGEQSGPGECVRRPTVCTKEWAPVCGCDGRNYSNDCVAHSHGAAIRHRGLCQEPAEAPAGVVGAKCGAPGHGGCATGLFCKYTPQAKCGAANKPGTCQPRPQACTANYDPVCGCDGKTYSNACSAHAAGVSVAKTAPCD